MTGAMYAAVAGLRAHMSAMNVIGNNISNVNTTGYKATRYTFSEALYTTVRNGSNGNRQVGGTNPAQVGYGASVGTIDLDMSTKNYTPTGRGLDCMIDGDGFFLLGNDKTNQGITEQSALSGMTLSRLGNLEFDANGYLVDGNGSLVYGFLRNTSTDEFIAASGDPNLNPEDVQEEQMTQPILTPIRYPMCYVHALGGEDGAENVATRMVTDILWPYADANGQIVDRTAPAEGEVEEGAEISRLQPNSVIIDQTGQITAMTKDEKLIVIGLIAIGTVDNPNGVTHVDGRYYQALGGAGRVHVSTVGGGLQYDPSAQEEGGGGEENVTSNIMVESSGDTKIIPGGLESSGTDLSDEITNLILLQRGYQANTRIVTVTDTMLEELINMKR
ncbi:MAG: flagellar hook-basal body complex protein [Oscillospiraceae bacterium]|nr:flagellar hook-basal body complex protein [Oscillospiraceae bacterium]